MSFYVFCALYTDRHSRAGRSDLPAVRTTQKRKFDLAIASALMSRSQSHLERGVEPVASIHVAPLRICLLVILNSYNSNPRTRIRRGINRVYVSNVLIRILIMLSLSRNQCQLAVLRLQAVQVRAFGFDTFGRDIVKVVAQ